MTMQPPCSPDLRQARALLGLPPGATVARCVARYTRLALVYDPRRWPGEAATQRRVIAIQDGLDAALALIVDAQRWGLADEGMVAA